MNLLSEDPDLCIAFRASVAELFLLRLGEGHFFFGLMASLWRRCTTLVLADSHATSVHPLDAFLARELLGHELLAVRVLYRISVELALMALCLLDLLLAGAELLL